MPKVSVIMPVYNKAAYVEKAIYSVLDQSMDDLELIVVNDGSTDRSLSIVQRIALRDNRVHVLDVPNGGVSRARNIGLEHSSGEWIQFLDADDWLEPEYLTKAMQELQLNPADILFSGFSMVDEQMTLVKEIALPEAGIVDQEGLCRQFIRYQRENGFFGYISNKLFRRSVWLQSGAVFPVGTRLAEDLHFYARLYPAVTKALFWQGKSFLISCFRFPSYYFLFNRNICLNSSIGFFLSFFISSNLANSPVENVFSKLFFIIFTFSIYSGVTPYFTLFIVNIP